MVLNLGCFYLQFFLTLFWCKDTVVLPVRKTPHTAHKGGSRELSHIQKFNKQAGWPRENGAAASLGGSDLK
jgi:hypothetical protein